MPANIGIAYEDVISSNPELWADFMKYVRLEGHEVYVIGEIPEYNLRDALDYLKMRHQTHWDRVLSVTAYLTRNGHAVYYDEALDRWRSRDEELWYEVKARLCFRHKISIMFEENPLHFAAFNKIPTRLIDSSNRMDWEMLVYTTNGLKINNSWYKEYEDEMPPMAVEGD